MQHTELKHSTKVEYTFLIGSLGFDALRRFDFSGVGKAISVAKPWNSDTFSAQITESLQTQVDEEILAQHVEKLRGFNSEACEASVRYAFGESLVAASQSSLGRLLLPFSTVAVLATSGVKRLLIPKGRQREPKVTQSEIDGVTSNGEADDTDPFDFDACIDMVTFADISGAEMSASIGVSDGQIFGVDEDILEVETETGMIDVELSDRENRLILEHALFDLGVANSGVNLDPYIPRIVDMLEDDDCARLAGYIEANDVETAITGLEGIVRDSRLGKNIKAYTSRLASVILCTKYGIDIPEKADEPAYEPIPGRIVMALHMRGPYESNGYVTRTQFVLEALKLCDFDVHPVTRFGYPNDLAKHSKANILEIEEFNGAHYRALPDLEEKGMLSRSLEAYIFAYAEQLEIMAREEMAEYIHAASNYVNGLAAIIAARRLGISVTYEVRGIWEITQASHNPDYQVSLKYELQRRMENLAVRSADKLVTISEPLKQFLIDNGAAEDRIWIVPNGVDTQTVKPLPPNVKLKRELGLGDDTVVVGYVGSIVHYEGLDLLIRAFKNIQEYPEVDAHCVIVGDGAQLSNLKKMASDLCVADKFTFTGRLPREEALQYFSIIDFCPLPRRSLPVTELVPPLKPYEAMASGKPVIISSVAAMQECVVEGVNGVIVSSNSVEDLTAALWFMCSCDDERSRMSVEAMDWVKENRSIKQLAERFRLVYS